MVLGRSEYGEYTADHNISVQDLIDPPPPPERGFEGRAEEAGITIGGGGLRRSVKEALMMQGGASGAETGAGRRASRVVLDVAGAVEELATTDETNGIITLFVRADAPSTRMSDVDAISTTASAGEREVRDTSSIAEGDRSWMSPRALKLVGRHGGLGGSRVSGRSLLNAAPCSLGGVRV
eukprot:404112-Rhodomonas_salina.1